MSVDLSIGTIADTSFKDMMERLTPRFARRERRERCSAYLRGLVVDIERKNGWQLAEAAGDSNPDGAQYFLNRATRDANLVRDDLQAYVNEHLGKQDGILIIDDTGFLKKKEAEKEQSA